MASVAPWFSRRKTPGDLETKVFDGRCNFLDENGEDIRFKEPGFRWGVFKERRKEIYKDYSERIQAAFDQVYEKITGVKSEKSQSPMPVLPTIKTPAISKSRSRIAAKLPTPDLSPQRDVAPVISQTTPLANTKNPVVEEVVENLPDPVVTDVTNTMVRRSMRFNKSKAPPNAPHQQIDIFPKEVEQVDAQPPQLASVRPKRNTRLRSTKATSASSSTSSRETTVEPVRRSTRATSRRAAAKAAQQRIENSFVEVSEEVPTASVVEESDSGFASEKQIKRKSVSVQQMKMSVCKVSLEKVASPTMSTSPTASAVGVAKETENAQQPKEEVVEANSSQETTQSTTIGDGSSDGEEASIPAPPSKRSLSVKPKRKVKGRGGKKGGARKGKKGVTAATRRVTPIPIMEEKDEHYEEAVLDPVEPMEEENSSATLTSAPHLGLTASRSSESVYESCVSEQSPVLSPPLTAIGNTKSPFTCENHCDGALDVEGMKSPVTINECAGFDTDSPEAQNGALATNVKKAMSRIPMLRLVKSPLQYQQFIDPKSPTSISPCDSLATEAPPLATTHVKSVQEKGKTGGRGMTFVKKSKKPIHTKDTSPSLINRDSPSGLLNGTYRVSPVGVPYLSKGHTPKTIQQLQEKLRSQTKGKLMSLEELRNASPLFKKLSAKKKVAATSMVVKDSPSTVLSPSKTPHLTPSSPSTLGSGIKRLRSVSLERLSSAHMTKVKRRSPKVSSGGSSDEGVVNDENESPLTSTGPGATGSSEEDTPLPPTTDEGSSQEDDPTNVSTAGSIGDELPTTPVPHPQEEEEVCPSGTGSSNKSDGMSNAATKDFLKAMFSKKNNFTKEDIAKKAPAVTSLIPLRNSPRKIETREARQEKLAEKLLRKREEEERRRGELKAKKLQELEEKKRRREAKAKKVAENQAALKEQELEKKKKLKGLSKDDPVQKLNQKRALEVREKQRKHREKAQAAEIKRREEEEAAKKRAQQIEEDWRIVTELASKRKEIEEEEKRQKRMEKQKEREQKRKQRELEDEEKRQVAAATTTTSTEAAAPGKKPPTATNTNAVRLGGAAVGKEGRASGNVLLKKVAVVVVDDPKKRMEELLIGAITKVKAPTPVVSRSGGGGSSGCGSGSSGEEACPGSGEKSNRFLKQFYGVVTNSGTKSTSSTAKTTKKTPGIATTTTTSTADNTSQCSDDDSDYKTPLKDVTNDLNSTFTKGKESSSSTAKETALTKGVENHPPPHSTAVDASTPVSNTHFHLMAGSALATTLAARSHEANGPQSYAMTPAESDPLFVYENYDIANLSSEDSTDDEECPRKVIPQWADSRALTSFMLDQEAALEANCIDVSKIFPPEQLLKDIDLARIFKFKRKRFFQRSSSAHWNSPLYKKNRFEI